MRGLGGQTPEILAGVEGGGYGRVYGVNPVRFSEYADQIRKEFSTSRAICFGADKQISKVASFCGAGCDNRAIEFAAAHGADVFVSSDMKHHEIAALTGLGINVIALTHYSAESYGFNKIYNEISLGLKIPSAFFTDAELI